MRNQAKNIENNTHTHIHTHIYIYIYIFHTESAGKNGKQHMYKFDMSQQHIKTYRQHIHVAKEHIKNTH